MKYILALIAMNIALMKINASTIDSTLVKQYQRGHDVVNEIIEQEGLKDSVANNPFCGLFFENLWAITVKKEKSYTLYYGNQLGGRQMVQKEIAVSDTIMTNLFSLDQDKIETCIYKPTNFYTPVYWYLLLTDSMHNIKFEWDAYSMCKDKYHSYIQHVNDDFFVYLFNIVYKDKKDSLLGGDAASATMPHKRQEQR